MKRQGGCRVTVAWLGLLLDIVGLGFGSGRAKADFTFGEATCVDQVINNGTNVQECSFLHDGLKLYFTNNIPGGYGGHDIWVSSRKNQDSPWEEPVNLGPNINNGDACYPAISPDELELYFHPGWDSSVLMRSTCASKDEPWGPATRFTGLGEPACDLDISADGLTVYFDSNRLGGYGAWDIWMATRETVDSSWGEPVNLGPNVNNGADQYSPCISNDGLALFYNNGGLRHISVATRPTKDDLWGPPALLGSAVNSPGSWQHGAEISPDGSVLYFDSNRSGGYGTENFWQVSIKPIVDFNGDGKVDGFDVYRMADRWGTDDSSCDIGPMPWGDGVVDIEDLKVLAQYIGEPFDDPTFIAHYELDETEGMVASDSAGAHDGIVHGDPVWQPDGGMIGGALQLDGVDDCIETPHILDPAAGPFSVFAWVQGGAPGQVILCQDNGAKWLLVGENGVLATELSCPGATDLLASDVSITDGNWHRVGLTWDGSTRTLYVDDVEVAADTQLYLASQDTILYIGASGPKNRGRAATFFCGLIDDVRIYNRAVKP